MMDRLLALYVAAQTAREAEEGQTAVEYALVLALVAVVFAISLAALDGKLDTVVSQIGSKLNVT